MSANAHDTLRASLWLRPSGDVLEQLIEAIDRYGERFGGQKPKPHLSLLGGITGSRADLRDKLHRFAARIEPPVIHLCGFDTRDEYYRCFFAKARLTEALIAVQATAMDVFGICPDDPFEPHVSLAYGQPDAAVAKELAQTLHALEGISFIAATVDLVSASGEVPVKDWAVLESVPLRLASRRDRAEA